MLAKRSRIQLAVFLVIAALALSFVSLNYVRLPQVLGIGQMPVYADFEDVSGLYPAARVTYRGYDIGKVAAIKPTLTGVQVELKIGSKWNIPSNARAEIHSVSAVGEQYVDLVPQSDRGPYLKSGATIPQAQTVGMPQAGDLLDSATRLVDSIPRTELSQLLDNVTTAFGGGANNLHALVSQSNLLVQSAAENLPATKALIANSQPFLNTQLTLAGEQVRTVTNLASFTDQLVQSRADLVRFLKVGKPFSDTLSNTVARLEPTLPVLLTNMVTVGQTVEAYLPAVEQTLVVLPAAVSGYQGALLPYKSSGQVLLDFKTNANNPPTCTKGYLDPKDRRDPRETAIIPTPPGLHCKLPNNSRSVVRGARNYPCIAYPGHYRAATIDECAILATGRPEPEPTVAYLPGQGPAVSAAEYEPTTGRFVGPDGKFYVLGKGSVGPPPRDWRQLVLSSLGR